MPSTGFGSLVRALMTEHGWSLRALARQIPVDPGQLSRILNGKRPPSPAVAEACDRLFGTGDRLVRAATPHSAPTWNDAAQDGDDAARRHVLVAGISVVATGAGLLDPEPWAAGRRIGRDDVTRIESITALYRTVDYECGGESLRRDAVRFAENVSSLADHAFPAVAPGLLSAIASARQLAGWACFDAGHHTDAQRHFLFAERAALAGDDHLLVARVRYCQARQFQHLRHNRDALATLRLAQDHVGSRATAAVTAMLTGAQAASLAAVGDAAGAVEALGCASRAFDRMRQDDEPEWMRFYDQGELLAQHGRVYRDLARNDARHARAAVGCSQDAVAAFGPGNVRSTVLNQVGVCSALFLADEPEQALEAGERLLVRARAVGSRRVHDRIRNLRRDLARHRGLAEVAAFDRRLAPAVPTR